MARGGFELSDDERGEVICVLTLAKLAGTGDRGNGDSDDAGECDNGVLASDNWSIIGLCICDEGLGIGTLYMGRGIWPGRIPTVGDTDVVLEIDRLRRGWETGSTFEIPIKLSTDIPICIQNR